MSQGRRPVRLATAAILSFVLGVLLTLVSTHHWQRPSGSIAEVVAPAPGESEKSDEPRFRENSARDVSESASIESTVSPTGPQFAEDELLRQVALPDGFPIFDSFAALHHQLEVENTDQAWATYMEPQLAAYFADERLSEQLFSAPTVECRRTLCEVQLIGYGPQAFTLWANFTADYISQPWMADLFEPKVQVDRTATGATAFVIFLQRRPGTF